MDRIGDYDVHRLIGEGGMGSVYEATERLSGRKVALKVLHGDLARTEEARQRFFREMHILAGLSHPNVVRSLASVAIDGKLCLVLEHLDGRNLREELTANGRLSIARAVAIAAETLSALIAAHERVPPVVHRDLKPENLMLLGDGSVKVMDFGIAKILDDKQQKTRTTQIVGTAQYMAPEQIEGRTVSPAVDLYALGLVLYEMLSGAPPFQGASVLALIRQQCDAAPPPLPDDVRVTAPEALSRLLFSLLAKSPAERPASARAVLAALQELPAPFAPPISAGSNVALPPVAAAVPAPAVGRAKRLAPAPHDTIAIIERLEQRRTYLWVIGGLLLALGAAVTLFILRSSSSTQRDADTTKLEASAPAPSAAPRKQESDGRILWQTPATWQRVASDERGVVALYRVPRAPGDNEDGELSVRTTSNNAADTRTRLRAQFDVCGPACDVLRERNVGGTVVSVIELSGTFWGTASTGRPKLGHAMSVAVVPIDATFYELRLTGPEKTASAARADFDALVDSLRRTAR